MYTHIFTDIGMDIGILVYLSIYLSIDSTPAALIKLNCSSLFAGAVGCLRIWVSTSSD